MMFVCSPSISNIDGTLPASNCVSIDEDGDGNRSGERPSCSLACIFKSELFIHYLDEAGLNEPNKVNFSPSFLKSHPEIVGRNAMRNTSPPTTEVEKSIIAGRLYSRIGHNEIRLLRLLPGSFNDPLKCELVQHKFQGESKRYFALSYTWGKPQFTARVVCNQVEVPITQNLSDALQHIRDQDIEQLIWIDALCINQSDLEEVGYLPYMCRI